MVPAKLPSHGRDAADESLAILSPTTPSFLVGGPSMNRVCFLVPVPILTDPMSA
jgi:hypothetical protein